MDILNGRSFRSCLSWSSSVSTVVFLKLHYKFSWLSYLLLNLDNRTIRQITQFSRLSIVSLSVILFQNIIIIVSMRRHINMISRRIMRRWIRRSFRKWVFVLLLKWQLFRRGLLIIDVRIVFWRRSENLMRLLVDWRLDWGCRMLIGIVGWWWSLGNMIVIVLILRLVISLSIRDWVRFLLWRIDCSWCFLWVIFRSLMRIVGRLVKLLRHLILRLRMIMLCILLGRVLIMMRELLSVRLLRRRGLIGGLWRWWWAIHNPWIIRWRVDGLLRITGEGVLVRWRLFLVILLLRVVIVLLLILIW